MQLVSQAWKDNQRQTIVPESFVEISMRVGDPQVQALAELSDNGHDNFANPNDILSDTAAPLRYASLEPGLWVLNGGYLLPGSDASGEPEGFIPAEETKPLVLSDGNQFFVST